MLKYAPMVDYKDPSPIRISTISALSNLKDVVVDLEKLFYNLPLVEGEPPKKKGKKKVHCDIKYNLNPTEIGVHSLKYYIKDENGVMMHHRHSTNMHDKTEVKCHFQNQLTLVWRFKSSTGEMRCANGFIFNNGKIKTVGLKCNEDILLSYETLVNYFMEKCITPFSTKSSSKSLLSDIFTFNEMPVKNLELFDTHPTMYNTDFSTHFKIMRDELFRIIIQEYNLTDSEYEPDIYPAVKIKFSWNKLYLKDDNCQPGKCYCSLKCNGKGSGEGDGNCKIVTVCVFQSGKIIITGGNQSEQVYYMYRYMNDILKLYYEDIYYREPFIEAEKKITKKKTKKVSPKKMLKSENLDTKIEFKDTSFYDKKQEDTNSMINSQEILLVPKIQITHKQVDSIFFGNYE
tara:strand:+ start:736 stop:1938 length:1203 start_codon:yes stop_codon:yes gene_type:complete